MMAYGEQCARDQISSAVDRNILLMADVDAAVLGGWSPLWAWSTQRGLVSFLTSIATSLTGYTHEVLFRDGEIMPAVPRDNHRGSLIGWGHKEGSTLGTSCRRRDKPVAYRIKWEAIK